VSADDRERYQECENGVREERCLQRCGRCTTEPFAVVDGVVVQLDHESVCDRFGAE
jgi:uncharacterized protein YuzB (UPF0349 family)